MTFYGVSPDHIKEIKYCCYYCANFNGECQLKKLTCYSAMGGPGYMDHCRIVDGVCNETFEGEIKATEAYKDCWKSKKEE